MMQAKHESCCSHPANALLPWFVRDTLQPEEMEWIRDHVDSCPVCSRECEDLAASRPAPPAQGVRWAAGRPYLLTAAITVPALLAISWIYPVLIGTGGADAPRLHPALYLDLGSGPTRTIEPLKELALRPGVDSIVISLLPPVTGKATLSLDLEGPRGDPIFRGEPIRGVDAEGRCSFSFPGELFDSPGDYTIIVREETPAGEVRLYPYPFRVGRAEREPASVPR